MTKTTLPFPSFLRYLKQFSVLGLGSTHICYSGLDTLHQISPTLTKVTTCCLFASRGLMSFPFQTWCFRHLFLRSVKNLWQSYTVGHLPPKPLPPAQSITEVLVQMFLSLTQLYSHILWELFSTWICLSV